VRRSWREFDDRAARLAGALVQAGAGTGSKVGLFLYNAPEFMESYFAALKIRAVPFNVNYRYVENELVYLLDNADTEVLVFHSSFAERVAQILPQLPAITLAVSVDDGGPALDTAEPFELLLQTNEPVARQGRSPDDVTMVYTGGTTGMPKSTAPCRTCCSPRPA
jgi:fatty-acyl-CoA synthase